MKYLKFVIIFLIGSLTFFLFSCEDPINENDGSVTFSFNLDSKGKNKRTKIEDATALIVSIEDEEGNIIHDSKEIQLYNFSGSLLSEPLPLTAGNYKLTKFLVLNENPDIIFATPLEGSTLAYLVDDPLPIEFAIEINNVTNVNPQVLDTEGLNPDDLGYTTFNINVVETFNLPIVAMVYNEETELLELTYANIIITDDGGSQFDGEIYNTTNLITLRNGYDAYQIVILKEGYNTYDETFSYEELNDFDDANPFTVILEKIDLNDGLLAYFPFNNNANDESGNGNDGTVNNAAFTQDRFGNDNSSLNFNGVDHSVEIPAINNFPDNQITVAVFVTPNQFYQDDCHWNQIIGNVGPLDGANAATGKWYISYHDNNNNCTNFDSENHIFQFSIDFNDNTGAGVQSVTKVELNQTYFIVGTYNGNSMKLYINGVLETEIQLVNKTIELNNTPIFIGKDTYHSSFPYNVNGNIDDIRIYKRALSELEIVTLLNQ